MNKRLIVICMLGFSSGLPLALLTSTLQAWFATLGASILITGSLSLIGLPYLYKPLWAPLTDRFTLNRLGRRRSWMLLTQVGLLLGFFGLSFYSPTHSAPLIITIAVILAILSATQDTVVDGQRVEYLPVQYHAIGAVLSILGYRIALLVSGAISLILAQKIGWAWTYRLLYFLLLSY